MTIKVKFEIDLPDSQDATAAIMDLLTQYSAVNAVPPPVAAPPQTPPPVAAPPQQAAALNTLTRDDVMKAARTHSSMCGRPAAFAVVEKHGGVGTGPGGERSIAPAFIPESNFAAYVQEVATLTTVG